MQSEVQTKNSGTKRHLFDDVDGFSDEDLEKPNFPGKQSSEKVPFILSDVHNPTIVQVPATINQYLRQYQKEGIAFLYRQYSSGKGAILADDMGLGKTVQVIGFISAVLGKTGTKMDIYGKFLSQTTKNKVSASQVKKENGTFLIVSPNSVLYNWHDELMTWGYFKVGKFHKNKRDETLERAGLGKLDVVLTTYETLRNHWETLNRIKWLAVVMDEVHHLKDPKRAVTIASKSLSVKCRIGLTGTPLQNRLLDFWSVLDWANPGCLGDKEHFTYAFGRPIMQGQRFDGTKRELATGRKKMQEFQSLIDEWCLRRTKALIADQLPKKDQKVVFCPLSKVQEDIYKTLLQTSDVQLVLKQGDACDCRSELTRGMCCYTANEKGSSMKKLLLQCLRLFLKVSNHAALLLPHVKQTDDQRQRAKAICEKVFKVHPEFEAASKSPSFELFSDSNFCGKIKVLDKLLKLFQQQKDKVLLFSYSTQLLDMLEAYVISCGMVFRRLDGKTRGERRLGIVREFNTNPDIFLFLVSTKAGGVGLNLTSANIVVVFDPSWNPANDLQAEDRAYRIGQRRDVKVFRLIASGTVEENMYLRQIYKQQLANIAVEGNNERRYFTAVDGEKDKKGEIFGIENLFALRNDGCSVSTDIFKRSDKIERGFRMTKYELQPQEDTEQKTIGEQSTSTSAQVIVETEEEENSYDLNEITSQFIEDETTNSTCLHNNSPKKDCVVEASHNENNSSDDSSSDSGEVHNEKRKFTKLLDFSNKTERVEKSLPLPHCDEKQKRQRNKQSAASHSRNRPISKDSQVNRILEECGVQHTHSNKMIIGTSEAENEMTSRAMKEVFDLGQYSQQPANCFAAIESDGEESDDIGDHTEQESNTKNEENDDLQEKQNNACSSTNKVPREFSVTKVGGRSILFGETPKAIRLRQFTEISQAHGFKSEVEFARHVVSGNTTERLSMLMRYYKTKDYPSESISWYSQIIESSQVFNAGDSEEKKTSTKNKKSVSSTRPYRKRQKSFTKVSKALVRKSNKTDRLVKKRRNYLKGNINVQSSGADNLQNNTTGKLQLEHVRKNSIESSTVGTVSSMSSTSSIDSLLSNATDNLQQNNEQAQSFNRQEEPKSRMASREDKPLSHMTENGKSKCFEDSIVEDKPLVSSTGTEQVCEDVLSEILTACCDTSAAYTQYNGPSRDPCDTECTSNAPSVPVGSQGSQTSLFLDEFLFECSQQTHSRTHDASARNASPSNKNTELLETKMQTSVIDDLI